MTEINLSTVADSTDNIISLSRTGKFYGWWMVLGGSIIIGTVAFLLALGEQIAYFVHQISFLSQYIGPQGAAMAIRMAVAPVFWQCLSLCLPNLPNIIKL